MRVKWLDEAVDDFYELTDFIAHDNATAAKKIGGVILEAVNDLVDFPAMGRPGRVSGTRELVISGTPYLVAYRVKKGTVEVLAVLHGARKWPPEFDR
jgi:toxin ParE1/3/4